MNDTSTPKTNPHLPLWIAFGILSAGFVTFVIVFAVYVSKGYKMLSSARGAMLEKVVRSMALGVVDGVKSAVSNSTRGSNT